jgi:hypothetical protein
MKASSTNGASITGCLHVEKMKIDTYLSPFTKLKSKWIKDLNINLDTLHLIEEKQGNTFKSIQTGDNFLNRTPMTFFFFFWLMTVFSVEIHTNDQNTLMHNFASCSSVMLVLTTSKLHKVVVYLCISFIIFFHFLLGI